MTKAPVFNSFNALKPVRVPSRSGVTAVLDAADKISREHEEVGRLARDNDMLRHQADELLTRVGELTTELIDVKAELALTTARLIAARDELRSVRLS